MAIKSLTGSVQLSPTDDVIRDCQINLCKNKVVAAGEKAAKETDSLAHEEGQQYKTCCLVKAQETNTFYNNLKYCIVRKGQKDAIHINGKLKELLDKDMELQASFKELVKMVKETKVNMEKTLEVACRLERCKEEEARCNPILCQKLEAAIHDLQDSQLGVLEVEVEEAYAKSAAAFDATVDVAGILTFSDLESMTGIGNNLEGMFENLSKDSDENVKSSLDSVQSASEELLMAIDDLSVTEFERCVAESKEFALCEVFNFLSNPKCVHTTERIKQVCEKFVKELPPVDQEDDCDNYDGTTLCVTESTVVKNGSTASGSKNARTSEWEMI